MSELINGVLYSPAKDFASWYDDKIRHWMPRLLALDPRFKQFTVWHTGGGCLSMLRRVGDLDVQMSSDANIDFDTPEAKEHGITVWVEHAELGSDHPEAKEHEALSRDFFDPIEALEYALTVI
jgi:hypothetical protein